MTEKNKFVFDAETTGLNPMEHRVTCISLLNIDHDTPVSFYGEEEAKILEQFWTATKDCKTLISFNGENFDIPFLIKRSIINKVKVNKNIKDIDLKRVVNSFFHSYNKYEKGKLSDWAKILGFEVKTGDGLQMIKFYEDKNWKGIKEHCEEDVMIIKSLFDRCKEVELLE